LGRHGATNPAALRTECAAACRSCREESPATTFPVVSLLVPASTGNAYDEQGFRYRIYLSGQDTSGSFALVEQAGRGGAGSPLHRHTREAETFFILDGDLDGWSDGEHMVVSAGDTLHLPAGSEHAFRIRSDTIRFLLLITPAGLERCSSARESPAMPALHCHPCRGLRRLRRWSDWSRR
jgi:quercetin dioxygenase-like cupin family protein